MESKFFPSPATLRELAGAPATGDATAAEAREELFRIVATMRESKFMHVPTCSAVSPRSVGIPSWPESTRKTIQYQTNRLRAADELLAKWTAEYR
jgi:hypothetical protein